MMYRQQNNKKRGESHLKGQEGKIYTTEVGSVRERDFF
jgi:hypothetical protein